MLLRLKHDVEIAMLERNLEIKEIKTSVVTDYIIETEQAHALVAAVSIW